MSSQALCCICIGHGKIEHLLAVNAHVVTVKTFMKNWKQLCHEKVNQDMLAQVHFAKMEAKFCR